MTSGAYIIFIMYGICSGGSMARKVSGQISAAMARTTARDPGVVNSTKRVLRFSIVLKI